MNVDFDNQDIIIELPPEGKDGRSVHPAGEWSADAEYHTLDLVSYNGSSYIAERSVPAGTLPTDTEYWQVIAEKGEPGASEWGEIAGNIADQTDLQDALDSKADVGTSYTKAEEDALLAVKANSADVYTKTETDTLLADKADADDVYTKDDVDDALADKADSADVYTKDETDSLLLGKAPVILSSASGSIASFSDGSASPVTALTVGIEPVQDLHGYDNPWPAGGRKNLVDPDAMIVGYYTATGAFDGSSSYRSSGLIKVNPNTAYTASIFDKTGTRIAGLVYTEWDENSQFIRQVSSVTTITTGSTTAYLRLRNYQAEISYITSDNYLYQLESGSSATSYAPYSNICPISGHDTATVTRTGKNSCDMSAFAVGSFNSDGTPNDFQTRIRSGFISVTKDATYTLSVGNYNTAKGSISTSVSFYANNTDTTTRLSYINWVTGATSTFTIPSDAKFIRFLVRIGDQTLELSDIDKVQVELGSSASVFEPYQPIQTVTIDLDGTRYGGELNVMTGEMTVDVMFKTLTGDSSEGWSITTTTGGYSYFYLNRDYGSWTLAAYNEQQLNADPRLKCNVGLVSYQTLATVKGVALAYGYRVSLPNFLADDHTVAEFRTYLASNPIQIVIPLKNPLTVTLSPSQLSTLLGQNNIWADTGDVAVEYRADTKLFVQGQVAQTAKVTRQMIADSATADGKAPKSLATGDLIIVGDELRKATANIGNGSAITASNSTIATLADVIKALQ